MAHEQSPLYSRKKDDTGISRMWRRGIRLHSSLNLSLRGGLPSQKREREIHQKYLSTEKKQSCKSQIIISERRRMEIDFPPPFLTSSSSFFSCEVLSFPLPFLGHFSAFVAAVFPRCHRPHHRWGLRDCVCPYVRMPSHPAIIRSSGGGGGDKVDPLHVLFSEEAISSHHNHITRRRRKETVTR